MRALFVGLGLLGCGKSIEPQVVYVPVMMPIVVATPPSPPSPPPPIQNQTFGSFGLQSPPEPPPTRELLVLHGEAAACANGFSFAVDDPSALTRVSLTDPVLCRRLAGAEYFAAELTVQMRHRIECEPVDAVICHVTGRFVQGTIVRLAPARSRATAELMRLALTLDLVVPGTITLHGD